MDHRIEGGPSRLQALIFDLDNTLYSYNACHEPALAITLKQLATQFSADLARVRGAYDEARADVKKRLGERASSHSRLLYLMRTFEILGYGPRADNALGLEQTYWRAYLARMELAEGFGDIFNTAKARRISLALATDLTAAIQIRKLIVLGLADTFDCIVTSEECQAEKSSGSVYATLLEKMALEPGPHLWMIGDSDADMAAKRHLGATTVFANFFGAKTPVERSDFTVTSVSDLARRIDQSFELTADK